MGDGGSEAGIAPESERWRAILRRDSRADGKFVFAALGTRIFCRPSCPARRPRSSNVIFFTSPREARRAGFRPCLRCRPEGRPADRYASAVREACLRISRSLELGETRELAPSALAAGLGLNAHQLRRAFGRLLGVTPHQFALAEKMRRLKSHLRNGADVTTALYEAGFSSSSRLYERTPRELGMTPAAYRQGGKGMRIGYTIISSTLGQVLVGATERGLAAVYLGDSPKKLEAALQKEYPRAEIRRDPGRLAGSAAKLLERIEGHRSHADLPLDVQATAFQRRVWQELQKIPYGETRTYQQVARAIGKPKAVRAVARACATNPVSVVVPCHRVVRADGKLAGYRWGLQRKEALLEREAATAKTS